jgi:hypothetical protein
MERESPVGCIIMPFCDLHPSNLGMLECPEKANRYNHPPRCDGLRRPRAVASAW